ncbi:MAG: flagellar basal body rod protein FlgB [Gammaproteobacteria bacterium]|nr:flagellar basal body rod protein FlgB [Gammaproteobacteria bacterium]
MGLDDTLGLHERALKLRTRRAEVLAGNIANADTPGFKARDFDFHKMLQQQQDQLPRMKVTDNRHIQTENGIVPAGSMDYRIPSQPTLDGNTVDSQLEHTAYAANALEYQASLQFLSGSIRKLKTAIKGQ